MIHIGIDLHSRNMTLVAISDNGKMLMEEKLANTPANLDRHFSHFDQPLQAVVEATLNEKEMNKCCGEGTSP